MRGIFIASLLFALMAACTGPATFEEHVSMPSDNWIRFRPAVIEYKAMDNEHLFDIDIVCRYRESILISRLNVMGTMYTPSGEERFREYHMMLKERNDSITGLKIQPGQGEAYYEAAVRMYGKYQFVDEGMYRFEVENLMSKYDNPGIISIGIRVTPSK